MAQQLHSRESATSPSAEPLCVITMTNQNFKIDIKEVDWLDDEMGALDRCAHGNINVIIGNESMMKADDWWNLSAAGIHLLRTLFENHTPEQKVGDVLIPFEGHHLDHFPYSRIHVETGGAYDLGSNWWVEHDNNKVRLTTPNQAITLLWIEYKNEVLKLVNAVEDLFNNSEDRILPEDEYDKEAYLKFWSEWHELKRKIELRNTHNTQ